MALRKLTALGPRKTLLTGFASPLPLFTALCGKLRPPPCLQRLLLASLNGLAGLLLLQGLPAEAVRAYREALALSE